MLSSRDVAIAASIAAVYSGYSFFSSNAIGHFTHGVDTFFIRSLLFVALTFSTTKTGTATLFGVVSGAIIEFTTPAPIHFYIFPSIVAYSVVYESILWKCRLSSSLRTRALMLATALSSLAMAVVALSVFTFAGFFPRELVPIIWLAGISRDVTLGLAGAFVGVRALSPLLQRR
jgi:hypothetical protein